MADMAYNRPIPSPVDEPLGHPKPVHSPGVQGQKNHRTLSHSSDTKSQKRRRSPSRSPDPISQKRRRLPSPPASGNPQDHTGNGESINREAAAEQDKADEQDPEGSSAIDHWAQHLTWPSNYAGMNLSESSQGSRKRQRGDRSTSYSQSVRDGDMPRAHTPAAEPELARNRLYMDEIRGRSFVSEGSKTQCINLMAGAHAEPSHTLFPLSRFLNVYERARNRNEARVVRDITPLLMPSAELLFVSGGHDELEHLVEEIDAEWSKPSTMGSSRPKPDFAVGISATAFTQEEISKMRYHTTVDLPTRFTELLYFPFLLGEAKSGDGEINTAERQNLHSASIAVNSVIQLYKKLGVDRIEPLMGKILVFSVSHDNERAKIYGHYAKKEESGHLGFYRYQITSFDFTTSGGPGWQLSHNFVRELYKKFYPEHLERIRSALEEMATPSPQVKSQADSQSGFTKPDLPAQSQIKLLEEQIEKQEKRYEESKREQRREHQEQIEKQERQYQEQVEKQERQYQEQAEKQERQYQEQVRFLREQSEKQERQNERQEKQYQEQIERQQKQYQEQIERQQKQSQEQIDMLKQLLNRSNV